MMKCKVKRICAIDSMYTLLQYLLLSSIEEIECTYFFWRNGVSEEVKKKFVGQSASVPSKFPFFKRLFWYYIIVPFKWPFVLKKNIKRFGCDNLGFEFLFFRKKNYSLLEDGLLSYIPNPYKWSKERFLGIKRKMFGPVFMPKPHVGAVETCERIFLTGLKSAPIVDDPRTEINSLDSLWNKSSEEKHLYIKKIYDVEKLDVLKFTSKNVVLLTQPFSEDGDMTENEKKEMYEHLIEKIPNPSSLVIKPHPREKSDYGKWFPGIMLLQTKVPIELLTFCGIRFTDVYTVYSSAVFDFPYNVRVHYAGSEASPVLKERCPQVTFNNIGDVPQHIDVFPW